MYEFASVSIITACKTWKCNHHPSEHITFITLSLYGVPLTKAASILWAAISLQFLSQLIFTNWSSFQCVDQNSPGWEWVSSIAHPILQHTAHLLLGIMLVCLNAIEQESELEQWNEVWNGQWDVQLVTPLCFRFFRPYSLQISKNLHHRQGY